MLLLFEIIPLLCSAVLASSIVRLSDFPSQSHVLVNPPENEQVVKIPNEHESAVMARRILHLTTIGTLVTSFPESHGSKDELVEYENRPSGVESSPIGLMEYIADCEPHTGNPTILALNIATPFRNYGAGSNISLSLRWWPQQTSSYDAVDLPTPRTPAALPRFSLHGYLEEIPAAELERHLVPACFVKAHPDSIWWQPGNQIHEAQYMRFVVEHVYWLGGFGDRARIQWLPIESWRNVTMDEVAACRLPGEKKSTGGWMSGWREWL